MAAARNTAFECSLAANVFVLDADNALFPRALSKLFRALQASGCAAAYAQLQCFGAATTLGLADIWHKRFFEIGNYVDAMALLALSAILALPLSGIIDARTRPWPGDASRAAAPDRRASPPMPTPGP